jgi:TPP-dependent pyruvate/acetoin dehydrogenase alpha subunit
LIECKTYRIRGHYEGDDTWDYRTREEVQEARQRDPIAYWKSALLAQGVLDKRTLEGMTSAIDREIAEAEKFAIESPFPAPEDALVLGGAQT